MALVLKKIANLYFYLNDEVSDPRLRDYLFMSNPFPMFVILGCYLMFVLKWGPKFMKNRKPYDLNRIMIAYNIIQIIACARLVLQGLQYVYKFNYGYSFLCEPVDYSTNKVPLLIANGCHTYFLLKVADLLDTVFFVLRKKENQISFLHLYHHTGMVVLTWNASKFYPGGHSVFTGFLNSIIHVVMYGYYLVSAFNPEYKNNIWWKKYITQMQIVQFFLIMMHWLSLLFHGDCGYPRWPVAIMIPQNLFMLALFGDFYYRAYVQKTKKREPPVASVTDSRTNGKVDTNGDIKYRHTNGIATNDTAKNGHSNGYSNGYTNGYTNGNANGNAANDKSNGNTARKVHEMS